MNSCNFTGRLTKDIELRYTNNNKKVVYFSLAVEKNFKTNDSGVAFLNFQAFGKTAEFLANYGKKGMYVEAINTEVNTYTKDNVTYTTFGGNSFKLIYANSKKNEEQQSEKSIEDFNDNTEELPKGEQPKEDLPF